MQRPDSSLLSVGIDIGTTSTHVAISRLHMGNASRINEPSRFTIQDREIIYQSPVYFTPLTADGNVDGDGVCDLVLQQYQQATINCADIDTGAVIITGETAKRRNASEVIQALSKLSGQFVVASAGPNLESVLAGKGSGAAHASKQQGKVICNIDVGGGTSNIAVFACGELVSTACLAVGGRFVRLTPDMQLLEISDAGRAIALHALQKELRLRRSNGAESQKLSKREVQKLANVAAHALVNAGCLRRKFTFPDGWLESRLLMTAPLAADVTVDEYWFSGGVAELMANPTDDDTKYGDIGVFLARAMVNAMSEHGFKFRVADQTIRATVIGAGMHSLQLSGSTVMIEKNTLPIYNIPVIRPRAVSFARSSEQDQVEPDRAATSAEPTASEGPVISDESQTQAGDNYVPIAAQTARQIADILAEHIGVALRQQDLDWSEQPVALFLSQLSRMNFEDLQKWADALHMVVERFQPMDPLVIVCTHDVAAALGQLLRKVCRNHRLIIVDGIESSVGEFIDIGAPLANRQSVPVVIKELVFAH